MPQLILRRIARRAVQVAILAAGILAILLVFFGTLAQVDEGIWTVLHRYFRTGIAWIPWQALVRFGQVFLGVPHSVHISGSFPFPGGWLIAGSLGIAAAPGLASP